MTDFNRAKEIVETWNFNKVHNRIFNQMDMRRFIEMMNAHTKMFVRAVDFKSVAEAQAMADLAQNAVSILTRVAQSGPAYVAARTFIRNFGVNEPDFYTGVMELAVHACTLLTPKARIIADGVDRTNV